MHNLIKLTAAVDLETLQIPSSHTMETMIATVERLKIILIERMQYSHRDASKSVFMVKTGAVHSL